MKILDLKLALATLFLFFSTSFATPPLNTGLLAGQKSSLEYIKFPKVIKIDGENFTLLNQNLNTAEFYLPNEEGYDWSKITSIVFEPNLKIQAYEKAFKKTVDNNVKYKIEYINSDEFKKYFIFSPMKEDPKYNFYEVNLGYAKNLKCGIFIFLYAKKFSPDIKEDILMKYVDEKMPIFLSSIPDIKCK